MLLFFLFIVRLFCGHLSLSILFLCARCLYSWCDLGLFLAIRCYVCWVLASLYVCGRGFVGTVR